MIGVGTAAEWIRFLEVRDSDDAVGQLRRMIDQLDQASDEVSGVLSHLSGSPSSEAEEVLRVSRAAIHEAIGILNGVIVRIRLGDPEAA